MSGFFVNMLKIFGFKVIGAVKPLLILDLSCHPDCSSKFKYMALAGTPELNELILKVGLLAARETSRLKNDRFQCSFAWVARVALQDLSRHRLL